MPRSASLFVLVLVLLAVTPPIRAEGGRVSRRQPPGEMVVVEGGEASLPCAITPPTPGNTPTAGKTPRGTVQLVLWYKDGYKAALYSYDGRDPHNPVHWRNSNGGTDSRQLSFTLPPTPPPMDMPHLAFLKLTDVQPSDEGVYSCRVDYHRARTTETRTKLTIVVSPSQPLVEVWANGRWRAPTREAAATQVEIGARLTLRCTVMGGLPQPEVTWWRGGEQLLGSVRVVGGEARSVVEVEVGEADAHTPLVCQAANTPLTAPLRTPLHLLVLSSPSWVHIVGANKPMSAGTAYMVECRSKGARPPPVLTWSVGGETNVFASSQTDAKGETVSRLRYIPEASHAGSLLTCTARPPDHTASSTPTAWLKSDSVTLSIMYKPEVELNFRRLQTSKGNNKKKPAPFTPSSSSSSSSSSDKSEQADAKTNNDRGREGRRGGGGGRKRGNEPVHEEEGRREGGGGEGTQQFTESKKEIEEEEEEEEKGEDEEGEEGTYSLAEGEGGVLQCHVRASPPAFHVSWHRDGAPLTPGSRGTWGVVVSNMSVVVQRARREDAGEYTCTAHNPEGSTRSDPVRLAINHGPECQRSTPLVMGAPRHHPLNVTCHVSAYPPPAGFSWALRSSVGLLQVPQNMITWRDSTSWISYTPRGAQDYGELLCWAHTRSGRRQEEPCVARLQPADTPDAPERCRVSRRTPSTLTVSCTAAHDGGLPQTFHVTVSAGERHVSNASSASSEVTVRGLQPDTAYSLTLWSANTHGASRRITLQASTTPANITVSTSSSMNGHVSGGGPREEGPLSTLGPPLVAVVAVVTVVGVVVGVVAGVLTRNITLPVRYSADHDDDDEDYHAAPPPSPGRRLKVHLRRSGRGNGALAEHLRRPSARYEFLETARREPHVYDDPVPLRREKRDKIYEELRATPETECSTLSATPSDPDSLKSCQSLPWHIPNSRLLRNNDFNNTRKPVRVEPPKLPNPGVCVPQSPLAASPTSSTKSTPGKDFRLILIPETSKMIQFAVERDTRLKSYFSTDASSPVSDGMPKFPVITEEEELKLNAKERDVCIVPGDPQNLCPREASINSGPPGNQNCFVSGDPQRLYQSAVNRGSTGNQDSFVSYDPQKLHHGAPAGTQDPRRVVVPSVRVECQPAAVERMNNLNTVNNNMAWNCHILQPPKEKIISVDENTALLPPGTPEKRVTSVCCKNARVSSHRPEPSPTDPKPPSITHDDTLPQEDGDQRKAREQNAGLEEKRKQEKDTAGASDDPPNISIISLPLVHGGEEKEKVPGVLGSGAPSLPLPTRHHGCSVINNNNNSGSESRHHPYRPALASIKRSYRSPSAGQLAAILDPMIVPVEGINSTSSSTSSSITPRTASQHKARAGLTALFSLTASSSSSSPSSSSSASSSSSLSSSSSALRKRGLKRSGRRSHLASPFWRPRSHPTTSGLHAATSPSYLHPANASSSSASYSSSSSPPSPRSSYSLSSTCTSSSSSCFPYSSTASSSPLSSFYSSENSLTISVSLSQDASSTSFPSSAASSSSFSSPSSSSSTSSPLSSFLSPSLTSHSASSFLSLSSCSTSPESTFSGQITPT